VWLMSIQQKILTQNEVRLGEDLVVWVLLLLLLLLLLRALVFL
jgi:hypothetical protein